MTPPQKKINTPVSSLKNNAEINAEGILEWLRAYLN